MKKYVFVTVEKVDTIFKATLNIPAYYTGQIETKYCNEKIDSSYGSLNKKTKYRQTTFLSNSKEYAANAVKRHLTNKDITHFNMC